MARKFALKYPVALLARNPTNYESLVKEIEAAGGKAIGISTDVSDGASVKSAFEKIKKESDGAPLTAAIFNVGGRFIRKPFLELNEEEFMSGMEANGYEAGFTFLAPSSTLTSMFCSRGAYHFAQAAIPLLQEATSLEYPPTLIFTSATAAMKGSANCSSFATGKFAMRALAQSLAREFGPKGLHVAHAIIDGVIDIERTKDYKFDHPDAKISPDAVSPLLVCPPDTGGSAGIHTSSITADLSGRLRTHIGTYTLSQEQHLLMSSTFGLISKSGRMERGEMDKIITPRYEKLEHMDPDAWPRGHQADEFWRYYYHRGYAWSSFDQKYTHRTNNDPMQSPKCRHPIPMVVQGGVRPPEILNDAILRQVPALGGLPVGSPPSFPRVTPLPTNATTEASSCSPVPLLGQLLIIPLSERLNRGSQPVPCLPTSGAFLSSPNACLFDPKLSPSSVEGSMIRTPKPWLCTGLLINVAANLHCIFR